MNLSDAYEAAESTLSTGINKLLGAQARELKLAINSCSTRGRQGEEASGRSLPLAPLETGLEGEKREEKEGVCCAELVENECSFMTGMILHQQGFSAQLMPNWGPRPTPGAKRARAATKLNQLWGSTCITGPAPALTEMGPKTTTKSSINHLRNQFQDPNRK